MAKSLLKFSLKTNIVKSIISEIVSNFSKYYYAYGRSYAWPGGDASASDVSESYEYELSTRNDLLFMKQIDANDVAPIVRRINWISGYTFDMYDEYVNDLAITGEIFAQKNSPNITGLGTVFSREVGIGNVITIAGVDYRVLAVNSDTEIVLSTVYTGATIVSPISITKKDSSYSGATSLETAEFYCITDDYNVYKCLYNNNNNPSTERPVGTSDQVITLSDGYKWKYMYTIPLSLRNKFMTLATMPVVTALNSQFYSAGSIVSASIENPGKSYDPNLVTLEVNGDGVLEENPYVLDSSSNGFVISNPGSGYSTVTLVFKDPDISSIDAVRAAATCTIGDLSAGSSTTYSSLTYNGNTATAIDGSFSRKISQGDVVKISGTQYLVLASTLDAAGLYPTSITVKGTITPTSGTTIYLSGCVTGITVTEEGYGYSKPFFSSSQDQLATNYVTFIYTYSAVGGQAVGQGFEFSINSKKNQAIITPLVSNAGEIVGIQVQKAGIGYTYATVKVNHNYPTEDDIPSDFVEASIILNFAIGDIESNQSTVELNAIPGAIHAVRVVDPGSGYATVPTVKIEGDGVGATARAVLSNNGTISEITVLTPGHGYTRANVVLEGLTPSQPAVFSVPIAPRGGHGSDAISELFCKTVVFTGILSREKNKGFLPTNEYRQICILKNPKNFGKNTSSRSSTASSCIVVKGSKGQLGFENITTDMVMTYTVSSTEKYQFRVIEKNADYSSTESALLLSYMDNVIPPASATYGNEANQIAFVSTSCINPDFDKLSGEMLTIDNRQRFSPSAQQIIVAANSLTF